MTTPTAATMAIKLNTMNRNIPASGSNGSGASPLRTEETKVHEELLRYQLRVTSGL
jgi:hypothetical protein